MSSTGPLPDMSTAAIDVLREPCQLCHLPVPLAGLRFCRSGGFACADREACGSRIERWIAHLKVTSARFRALCSA